MASLQQPHSERSRREEPPWGGSTRLCERKGKSETRKREPVRNLASPAAAYAPTAPPRLRRCRRPPRGPPPEARWRQFRCPGSPDFQASPLRSSAPSPAGATSVRARPARKTRGRCRGAEPGRSLGHARWAGPPTSAAGPCLPEPTRRSWTQHHPSVGRCMPEATSQRAVQLTWGGACVERGGSVVQGRDPQRSDGAEQVWGRATLLTEPSRPAQVGRHLAPPPQ